MSKFAGFVNGFSNGLSIGSRLNSMMDQGDIDEIARANPEQSTGFTADQGDELRRAAESGQYDIGWDESSKSYVVTPKSDPSMAAKVTQQGVTDFLGKRTAGTMSDTDVANARQRAIAGVVSRSDPVQGSRMMRDVTMAERDDKRFGWEEARATREMRKGAEEDANDAFMKTLEGEVGQFMQGRLAGQDGQTRPATTDDYLAATQFKAAKLIEAGKTDAAQALIKEYNAQSFVKIQLETAQRDQALGQTIAAVNAGNLDAARQFYDRFLPDGATVTGVKQGANGSIVVERQSDGGQPMPPMTFKDVNHLTSSLAALKDPTAVYNWSQNEFRNALALRQDSRAERAEGRAAASAGASKSEKEAQIAAGLALYRERNPNATPAELEAVARGVLPAVPDAAKNAPSEVKLATAMVEAGLAPDMRAGLEMAVTKKSQSARETYLNLMKPNSYGRPPKEQEVAPVMEAAYGPDWRAKVNGGAAGGPQPGGAKLQNVTEADIKAEAKKYGVSEAEIRRQLGL